MKALKNVMVVLVALACIMPVLGATEAQAAATWVTCWVNQVGQGQGIKYVQLTDATGTQPAVNHMWFGLIDDGKGAANAMFTTALTALTSGLKVYAYVGNTTLYSSLYYMYLMDK